MVLMIKLNLTTNLVYMSQKSQSQKYALPTYILYF